MINSEQLISGKDNPKIKYIRSLHNRKTAIKEGVIFVEGMRLCEDALNSGFSPIIIVYQESKRSLVADWLKRFPVFTNTQFLCVSTPVFEKISSTVSPQGVAAVVTEPKYLTTTDDAHFQRIMVCENVSDPGNLGNIMRSAEAFDFSELILVGQCADPYNEKVLRSSMGACFRLRVRQEVSCEEVCLQLRNSGVQLVATHLSGRPLSEAVFERKVAVFMGNEAHGLSQKCSDNCDMLLKIPMPGRAESLNVASAAAILSYVLMQEHTHMSQGD
ncbi:MAG: RNA methyltransferase [Clostridiaceae bacterium]|nr:RNA methyltransferase [Clostridiaceae bacterium]